MKSWYRLFLSIVCQRWHCHRVAFWGQQSQEDPVLKSNGMIPVMAKQPSLFISTCCSMFTILTAMV